MIVDGCDLCAHAFDPGNRHYVDDDGSDWLNDGHFCNGSYGPPNLDPANHCNPPPGA